MGYDVDRDRPGAGAAARATADALAVALARLDGASAPLAGDADPVRCREQAAHMRAGSLAPSDVAAGLALDRYLDDEARLFLRAALDGGGALGAFRPGCPPRPEGLRLVHRTPGGGWGVSARGRAYLAAPVPGRGCPRAETLRRLPGALALGVRQSACAVSSGLALAILAAAWTLALTLSRTDAVARIDAGWRLG